MVKMILRPSTRRSSQNSAHPSAQGLPGQGEVQSQGNQDHSTNSDIDQNSLLRRSVTSNPNQIDSNCQRKSAAAARKVIELLDSPRRALMGKATRSISSKQMQSSSSMNIASSKMHTNSLHKTPSDNAYYYKMEDTDCMEVDEMKLDVKPCQTNGTQSSHSSQVNVMTWLHNDAPHDIIPKVLSFLGPKKHQLISKVNKSWREICLADGVFRTLCEDYGKWEEGKDSEPMCGDSHMDVDGNESNTITSWRELYCRNPIVPLDYPTIQAALDATGFYNTQTRSYEFMKNARVLLNPGIHVIERCIRAHIYGNAQLSVETLEPRIMNSFHSNNNNYLPFTSVLVSDSDSSSNAFPPPTTSRRTSFRQIFTCRSGATDISSSESSDDSLSLISLRSRCDSSSSDGCGNVKAMILSKARRHNTPVFHVTQGTLKILNVAMVHNSNGVDIWNGNAAVQVQPHIVDNRPLVPQQGDKMPNAIVEESDITSISGRGIVAIDGGLANIKKCRIFKCAATGIYVGGPGSEATVLESDIVRNGNGNERNRRGIARGHSGVYLEQGIATLINCNVSNNSLTGISAISQTNAVLTVRDSDLVGNGTVQLELPPVGSVSRQRSSTENNNISTRGVGRSRILQELEDEIDRHNSNRFTQDVEDGARRIDMSAENLSGVPLWL